MSQVATAERHADDVQKPASGISLRVVVNAVRRHPIAFSGLILLAVAVGLGIWFFLPLPKKTAAAVFHISQPQTLQAAGPANAADFASYKQSQLALIKSRRTSINVLKDPDIAGLQVIREADPDALTWLDQHVKVDSKPGSEYIRVTIEGDNSDELLVLLKSIEKAYKEMAFDRDHVATIRRHAELNTGIRKLELEQTETQKAITKIAELIGGKTANSQTLNDKLLMDAFLKAVEEAAVAQSEFDTIATELAAAKWNLLSTKQAFIMAVAGAPWVVTLPQSGATRTDRLLAIAVEEALRQDRRMQELEEVVTRSKEALRKTEELFERGTKNVQIDKARLEIETAERARDAYRNDAETRYLVNLKLRAGEVAEGVMAKLQSDHDRAKSKLTRAKAKEEAAQNKILDANSHKAKLEDHLTAIAQKEKLKASMTEEFERLKLELNLAEKSPRVETSEEPYVMNGIEGNRRLKYSLMAGLGALVFGFGGLVIWEHRSRRVTRTEEVSTELGTRLIGTIPPLASGGGVAATNDANTPMIEAIDTARIMLTHAGKDGSRLRVLMVTSAVSGEGKTTLSGNLAISLTRAGFRTLLIDGDMQAPSAHLLFDLPDAPGLSELLRGESDVKRAVRQSPIPGLSILPAGRWNMSTRQSLVGDRWRVLKEELESEFDFVVIDTSPLLMVSDAMLLAREADGVVLSVLLGVSQIARVAETVNRLHAIGAELAGVVVNNVQSEVYRRYMARSKYASLAPVAPDHDGIAPAEGDRNGSLEPLAEEIGTEMVATTKEG